MKLPISQQLWQVTVAIYRKYDLSLLPFAGDGECCGEAECWIWEPLMTAMKKTMFHIRPMSDLVVLANLLPHAVRVLFLSRCLGVQLCFLLGHVQAFTACCQGHLVCSPHPHTPIYIYMLHLQTVYEFVCLLSTVLFISVYLPSHFFVSVLVFIQFIYWRLIYLCCSIWLNIFLLLSLCNGACPLFV